MQNEEHTVRARLLDDGTVVEVLSDGTTRLFSEEDGTDWARLAAMTEEEIEANALADPDNPPWTEEELANAWSPAEARRVRMRLNMTQEEFAAAFQIPLGTLRDWERGASFPDASARTLLRVIAREPEAVLRALAG
jgi:putative transcriptional regulator